MGAGMARSLLRQGIGTTVWNRSPEKAAPLASDGATVAGSAADAVAGADVVITMLFDVESVLAVMADAAPAIREDAVWVQASTVGVEGIRRVEAFAAEHAIEVVDAPVLGTKAPAENGRLRILAAGPTSLRDRVQPVFEAVGEHTEWISTTLGGASRLKLVVNAWIATIVNGAAQSIALARGLGLDPAQFLDTIAGQAVDSQYAQLKGKAMLAQDYTPSFELDGLAKDVDLVRQAMAETGIASTVADALADRIAVAAADGHGHQDMAAVVHAYRT